MLFRAHERSTPLRADPGDVPSCDGQPRIGNPNLSSGVLLHMSKQAIFCDCYSPNHNVIFEVDEFGNDGVTQYKELMVYVNLRHYAGFFKRLKNAYKYVTKKDVDRVDYLDILVSHPDELRKLKSVIDEVLEFNERV
jgi:hypothetical protein